MWRNSCYVLAVVAGLATAGPALARVFPVKDQGEFIQNKASLERLNELLKEIDKRFGKEVLIETFSAVPPGDLARVKAMDKEARSRYFSEQARERARRSKVNGFYIFANKVPASLQVLEGDRTSEVFPAEKIREVRALMLKHFENKDFDGGFVQGVEYIRNQLAANPAARANPAAPALPVGRGAGGKQEVNWAGIICIGLAVVLVIWLVIGLIRGMSGRGAAGAGAGAGGGGGGGGFMTGLLGGLVGAVAGNWLYHNMFGGGSGFGSQAHGDSGGTTGGDTDYSGSGGEWGDGGGGGDAGGDWGGGGGGGGDWGGGGGGGDW